MKWEVNFEVPNLSNLASPLEILSLAPEGMALPKDAKKQ